MPNGSVCRPSSPRPPTGCAARSTRTSAWRRKWARGARPCSACAQDIASLVASLPPDPRNTPVAVRAARFEVQGDTLAYNVVLSREHAGENPFGGVMQLVVAGASGRADDTVTLTPVPISVGLYDTVRGSLPLPQGFKPRQTTIHVLDKVGGKLMGMRVINVN